MLNVERNNIQIMEHDTKYAEDTVRMWRKSMERAIGQKDIHTFKDHVFFLNNILIKDNKIYIRAVIYS